MQTKAYWVQAKQLMTGGGQPQFNANTIAKLKIPLPPLATQEHIVSIMDAAYTTKKQKETEAKELLDSINGYVLTELGITLPELKNKMCFVVYSDEVKGNRCDPYYYQPKFKELQNAITNGKYEVKDGKDIFFSIDSGKGISPELFLNKGIGYLEVKNIDFLKLIHPETFVSKEYNIKTIDKGDILTGRVGSIGNFVLINDNLNFSFSDNILRIKCKNDLNKYYLTVLLNSVITKLQIDKSKKGSLQNVVNQQTLKNLKIPFPPLSVQEAIAYEVKCRMQRAEQLQREATEELAHAKQKVEEIILG